MKTNERLKNKIKKLQFECGCKDILIKRINQLLRELNETVRKGMNGAKDE